MGQREVLNNYLAMIKNKPFQWGVHDCLTFTNDCFREMHGEGWADDWLGRYMINNRPMRRTELIKEFKSINFNHAVDQKLERVEGVPPLGALVTTRHSQRWITGVAMGICTGTKGAFLTKNGVLYLPLDYIENAWVKQ
jgi:hypothetical protein